MNDNKNFVVSPAGRMAWPRLLKPDERGKYSVDILIPKSDPGRAAFVKRVRELQAAAAGSETIGEKARYGLMDGDTMEDANGCLKKDSRPEYAGCIVVRGKTKRPPTICDESGNQVIEESEVYGGRWAQVSVEFYYQSFKDEQTKMTKKMVCCSLRAVKLGRHDERFGGGFDTSDDFGPSPTNDDLL